MSGKRKRMKLVRRQASVVLRLRLNQRSADFVRGVARHYATTDADALRAMLERIAVPALRDDIDVLQKQEKESYR